MIGGLPRKSASPGLLRTAIPPSSGFPALLITSRGLFVVALVLLCLLLSTKSGGVITVAVLKVLGISALFVSLPSPGEAGTVPLQTADGAAWCAQCCLDVSRAKSRRSAVTNAQM